MAKTAQQNLFESYLTPALNTAYGTALCLTRNREDAEDLVQDAAVRAYTAFASFQPGTNFKAWFLRILTNLFLNRCRRLKREAEMIRWESAEDECLWGMVEDRDRLAHEAHPVTHLLRKLTEQEIAGAFAQLPEEFRTVCVLYFMDEFSYQEIADIVECPIGTVRSRLHRGRKVLQQLLRGMAEERGHISMSMPQGAAPTARPCAAAC